MQKLLPAIALTAALALPATAGGPVLVEDRYDTETEAAPRANWVAPVVIGLVLICAIACGGDKDDPVPVKPVDPCNGCN